MATKGLTRLSDSHDYFRVSEMARCRPAGAAAPGRANGLQSLDEATLRSVVDAVRFEVDGTRDAIHRLRRIVRCDLHIRVEGGTRLVVGGECLCRDFLVDMLLEADRF